MKKLTDLLDKAESPKSLIREAYELGKTEENDRWAHLRVFMQELAIVSGYPHRGYLSWCPQGSQDILAKVKTRYAQPTVTVSTAADERLIAEQREQIRSLKCSFDMGTMRIAELDKKIKELEEQNATLTERNKRQQRHFRDIAKAVGKDPTESVELHDLTARVLKLKDSERDLIQRNEKLALEINKLRRTQVDEFQRGLQQGRSEVRGQILAAASEGAKVGSTYVYHGEPHERTLTFTLCDH